MKSVNKFLLLFIQFSYFYTQVFGQGAFFYENQSFSASRVPPLTVNLGMLELFCRFQTFYYDFYNNEV